MSSPHRGGGGMGNARGWVWVLVAPAGYSPSLRGQRVAMEVAEAGVEVQHPTGCRRPCRDTRDGTAPKCSWNTVGWDLGTRSSNRVSSFTFCEGHAAPSTHSPSAFSLPLDSGFQCSPQSFLMLLLQVNPLHPPHVTERLGFGYLLTGQLIRKLQPLKLSSTPLLALA